MLKLERTQNHTVTYNIQDKDVVFIFFNCYDQLWMHSQATKMDSINAAANNKNIKAFVSKVAICPILIVETKSLTHDVLLGETYILLKKKGLHHQIFTKIYKYHFFLSTPNQNFKFDTASEDRFSI